MSIVENHIYRVALVGGTGSLGGAILTALLASTHPFQITLITRSSSVDSIPETIRSHERVKIAAGSYDDHAFLTSTLKGQDALVLSLSWTVYAKLQPKAVDAAVEAGVAYILPVEFGSDTANPRILESMPFYQPKIDARNQIISSGVSKFLGVVNNAWYDWSLAGGFFGIDIAARKAIIFDGGDLKINTSTLEMSGRTVASLLSLPVKPARGSPNNGAATLEEFANGYVYVRSFQITQREMLESVMQESGTSWEEWNITETTAEQHICEGQKRMQEGDLLGVMNILYGYTFTKGVADAYSNGRLDNEALGLREEELHKATKKVVAKFWEPQS